MTLPAATSVRVIAPEQLAAIEFEVHALLLRRG